MHGFMRGFGNRIIAHARILESLTVHIQQLSNMRAVWRKAGQHHALPQLSWFRAHSGRMTVDKKQDRAGWRNVLHKQLTHWKNSSWSVHPHSEIPYKVSGTSP